MIRVKAGALVPCATESYVSELGSCEIITRSAFFRTAHLDDPLQMTNGCLEEAHLPQQRTLHKSIDNVQWLHYRARVFSHWFPGHWYLSAFLNNRIGMETISRNP